MKKLGLSVAIAAAFAAGSVHAYDGLAEASPGLVVPVAYYDASSATAVGIINHSTANVAVFWSFHDQDSNHVTDGTFCMTGKDFFPFIWNEATAGSGLSAKQGYLVFGVGSGVPSVSDKVGGACASMSGVSDTLDSNAKISGSAFQVLSSTSDVSVTPVFPLVAADFARGAGLSTLNSQSIIGLAASPNQVSAGVNFSLRYVTSTSGNDTSTIYIWSPNSVKGQYTVNAYDNQQNRKSVNLDLPNRELNIVNPAKIVGMPTSFTDGFIEWTPPVSTSTAEVTGLPGCTDTAGCNYAGIVSYTVVNSKAFGAVQTMLNATF